MSAEHLLLQRDFRGSRIEVGECDRVRSACGRGAESVGGGVYEGGRVLGERGAGWV